MENQIHLRQSQRTRDSNEDLVSNGSPDRHEDEERKTEASDAPIESSQDETSLFHIIDQAVKTILLAGAISALSRQTLAPVFGSIPLTDGYAREYAAVFIFGVLFKVFNLTFHNFRFEPAHMLMVYQCWLPTISDLLASRSDLSQRRDRLHFECYTTIAVTGYLWEEYLANFVWRVGATRLSRATLNRALLTSSPPLAYAIIYLSLRWVPKLVAPSIAFLGSELTPIHLQYAVAVAYLLLVPKDQRIAALGLGLPGLLYGTYSNPHMSNSSVNAALQSHNWTLLDRAWSNTGYISVLESTVSNYRVLRADHSLLGGEWLLTPERASSENWKTNEPIYAVFEMLEAVRLMQVTEGETVIADTSAQALVIGLGIGTAPKALLEHGIDTTVVEVDPVVHRFAVEYFDLPTNHTAVLQDAVTWVGNQAAEMSRSATASKHEVPGTGAEEGKRYDWIIHDVFTGGAEPIALFTDAFLCNLRTLLLPHGAIAINYAGDLSLPLTRLVLRTIHHVFDGQCKIFRDAPVAPRNKNAASKNGNVNANAKRNGSSGDEEADDQEQDFLNMVVFCRNSAGPISFRQPSEADFLGSLSRQHYMLPKAELEIPFPQAEVIDGSGEVVILKSGDEASWYDQQLVSAKRHWGIMRTVLPAAVWESW